MPRAAIATLLLLGCKPDPLLEQIVGSWQLDCEIHDERARACDVITPDGPIAQYSLEGAIATTHPGENAPPAITAWSVQGGELIISDPGGAPDVHWRARVVHESLIKWNAETKRGEIWEKLVPPEPAEAPQSSPSGTSSR